MLFRGFPALLGSSLEGAGLRFVQSCRQFAKFSIAPAEIRLDRYGAFKIARRIPGCLSKVSRPALSPSFSAL